MQNTIVSCVCQVEGLLFVVLHSSLLVSLRKDFQRDVGDVVSLANEQTSCHQAIAESLAELKVYTHSTFMLLSYTGNF